MTKTAVELAEWLEEDIGNIESHWAAALLRQQAAEIEALKARAFPELPEGYSMQLTHILSDRCNFWTCVVSWKVELFIDSDGYERDYKGSVADGPTPAAAVQAALDKVGE